VNGARIVTLPGKKGKIRVLSDVSLLIITQCSNPVVWIGRPRNTLISSSRH
jgi:hypothetical protein